MSQAAINTQDEMSSVRIRTSRFAKFWREVWRYRLSYLFLAPFFLLFLTFTVIPVVVGIVVSFMYYNVIQPPKFVGLANYRALFLEDDIFILAIMNTIKFAVITGPVGYILSFLMAWLINQVPQRFRFWYTLCFYMPALTSTIVIGTIWQTILSGDRYGILNYLLMKLGILHEPFLWLQDIRTIMPMIIFVQLWMSMGLGFLAFIAGIQNVPNDLYEAGAIDGIQNRWQQVWYITIPYIKPQLLFGAVLQVVAAFNVAGGISAALVGEPSPHYAGHTIMNHMNDYAYNRYEMGYASAISVILFLVMIGINRFIFKWLGSDN